VLPSRITGLDPAGPFFDEKPLEEKLNYRDAELVDIIHTSDKFGLAESLGHMDFYQDGGASHVKACDQVGDRASNLASVVVYEEENSGNRAFEDVQLSGGGRAEWWTTGSVKAGVAGRAKSLWKKVKGWFVASPRRAFLQAHQFFGCSHLMAVRYFIYSINTCAYAATQCPDLAHFHNASCPRSQASPPRMGYHAHLSASLYTKSRAKLFVHTSEKAPYCLDPVAAERARR